MVGNSTNDQPRVSRRKLIIGTGALAASVAGCIGEASAAEVSMGSLNVSGDTATVTDAPSAIDIAVAGGFEANTSKLPEQNKLTLQVTIDDETDDLANDTVFDASAGDYSLSGDLLEHRDFTTDDFTPAAGETISFDLTVRVIYGVVVDGSLVDETSIEDTAPIEITSEGVELLVGGEGDVTISD